MSFSSFPFSAIPHLSLLQKPMEQGLCEEDTTHTPTHRESWIQSLRVSQNPSPSFPGGCQQVVAQIYFNQQPGAWRALFQRRPPSCASHAMWPSRPCWGILSQGLWETLREAWVGRAGPCLRLRHPGMQEQLLPGRRKWRGTETGQGETETKTKRQRDMSWGRQTSTKTPKLAPHGLCAGPQGPANKVSC